MRILSYVLIISVCLGFGNVFPAESVNLSTRDGVIIKGAFSEAENTRGGVILLHMLGRDKSDWEEFSGLLNENGFDTLAIDLRGHGESLLRGRDVLNWQNLPGWQFQNMTLDVEAAYVYLMEHYGDELPPLFIVGASIGANVGLRYAVMNRNIDAVVLLSPGLDYRGIKTKPSIMLYERPIFVAASENDEYALESSGLLYEQAAAENKIFEKYEGAAHGTDMLKEIQSLQEEILTWFQEIVQEEKEEAEEQAEEEANLDVIKGE